MFEPDRFEHARDANRWTCPDLVPSRNLDGAPPNNRTGVRLIGPFKGLRSIDGHVTLKTAERQYLLTAVEFVRGLYEFTCTPIWNTFYYTEKSRTTTEFVHGCLGRFEEEVTPRNFC